MWIKQSKEAENGGLPSFTRDFGLKKELEYADHGKTVFVTSHNIELVSRICDRVAIVNNGVVAALYDLNKEPNRRLQLGKLFVETYGE